MMSLIFFINIVCSFYKLKFHTVKTSGYENLEEQVEKNFY